MPHDRSVPFYSAEVALAMQLGKLSDRWLHVCCGSCTKATLIPIKLLARKLGTRLKLQEVLPRLVCRDCAGRPKLIELQEDSGGGAPDRVPPWRIELTSASQAR